MKQPCQHLDFEPWPPYCERVNFSCFKLPTLCLFGMVALGNWHNHLFSPCLTLGLTQWCLTGLRFVPKLSGLGVVELAVLTVSSRLFLGLESLRHVCGRSHCYSLSCCFCMFTAASWLGCIQEVFTTFTSLVSPISVPKANSKVFICLEHLSTVRLSWFRVGQVRWGCVGTEGWFFS